MGPFELIRRRVINLEGNRDLSEDTISFYIHTVMQEDFSRRDIPRHMHEVVKRRSRNRLFLLKCSFHWSKSDWNYIIANWRYGYPCCVRSAWLRLGPSPCWEWNQRKPKGNRRYLNHLVSPFHSTAKCPDFFLKGKKTFSRKTCSKYVLGMP